LFSEKKLYVSASNDDDYSWTVFQGESSINESDLYNLLGMNELYAESVVRDKKVKNRLIGGLALLSSSIFMILYYNDESVPFSGNTLGYDCSVESDYCYKRNQPYRMYGFGIGIFSIYNLYSSYFKSGYYKRIVSKNEIEKMVRKYNIILIKKIISEENL